MIEEIWKDVVGYEGLYQVSNLGNVRSIDRLQKSNKAYFLREGTILKQRKCDGKYLSIHLSKNNVRKIYKVHRLVAIAFIPNPESKPQVNHINGNKTDNRVENLEWCTASENTIHSYKTGLQERTNNKKIMMVSKTGDFIKTFNSISEANENTGVDGSSISKVCLGKRKTAGGYIWRYKNNDEMY